jgi:exonuclease V
MQQGTEVHERLERQVYTTVKVDVATKEDAWGLRIWNVIQGLRTLRETGLTREMELWGVIDGFVVNGVIDELSYICPDEAKSLEAAPPEIQLPADQTPLSNFFKVAGGTSIAEATRSKRRFSAQKVYIADVKTRGTRTLPSASAFRPTKIQLMLYHRLLAALATNTVDFSVFTTRYNLDPDKTFSDEFIAQVVSLNDELFSNDQEELSGSHESEPNCSQDSLDTLLAHNNLSSLWSLMISEFHLTLPDGAASLGRVLKAEYRSRGDGEILGSKTFLMDEADLTSFVTHEMEWWKGERDPQGVVVEEAFKCRSCDFADECEWRLNKVEEAIEKARMTRKRTAAT